MATTCITCGQPIPVGNGRCRVHQSPQRRWRSSSRWRALSETARLQGRCGMCGEAFLPRDLEADHIRPISDGGDPFEPMNIWALCKPCHRRKTNRELAGDW